VESLTPIIETPIMYSQFSMLQSKVNQRCQTKLLVNCRHVFRSLMSILYSQAALCSLTNSVIRLFYAVLGLSLAIGTVPVVPARPQY
jgi:hypothetical protein